MPSAAGNKIATRTHLLTAFGCTEAGVYALELPEAENWHYIKLSPAMGYEMRHSAEDLHELYFVRHLKLADIQPIFATFPNISEYPTKDLFSKHPTKDDLWLCRGRADDIIAYSTGEKMNPLIRGHGKWLS